MVQLFNAKEKLFRFVGQYEVFVFAAIRFVVAFITFMLINKQIGSLEVLNSMAVCLIFALISSFLPAGVMIFFAAVLILGHFYSLSLELCAVTGLIFLILFCAYLRASTGKGMYAMLTGLLGNIGMPFVVPIASGLYNKPYSVISCICGYIIFSIVKTVEKNIAMFQVEKESLVSAALAKKTVTLLIGNKEMYVYILAFAIGAICVACLNKMAIDHVREISVVVGGAAQLIIVCAGEALIKNAGSIPYVILGCVISILIALGMNFMTHSLNYKRVENVQFEDDEYYYYVKAVPKAYVNAKDKQVKTINTADKTDRQ